AHEDLLFGPDDEGIELAARIPVRGRFLKAPGVPEEFDHIIERGGLINAGRATERLRIEERNGAQSTGSRRDRSKDRRLEAEEGEGEVPRPVHPGLSDLVPAEPQE